VSEPIVPTARGEVPVSRLGPGGSDVGTMGALGAFAEWHVYDQFSLSPIA
jgi:hypothetical protein